MKFKSILRGIKKKMSFIFMNFLSLILVLSLISCLQNKASKQEKSIATIPCQLDSESDSVSIFSNFEPPLSPELLLLSKAAISLLSCSSVIHLTSI